MEGVATTPGTSALFDVYAMLPLDIVSGSGVVLRGADGREYLDFYGGHAVAVLGHGHPGVLAALERQARALMFQSNLVRLEGRERAARRLLRFGPPGMARVFFVNSGAEANENALRLAFRVTGRRRVVAVQGAFHGRTAAAGAVTDGGGDPGGGERVGGPPRWYGFPERPFPVTFVGFDDPQDLGREVGDDVAAVIVEPVQGVAGARALSPDFLRAARDLCTRHGAVLIFDEVQCGMGRTGHPFAAQAHDVTPDVLTVAKGLAGGFPAGAVLAREEVASRVGHGDLGTTFGGGPLACALVEAVIDAIEGEGLLERVRRLSDRMWRECVRGPVESVQGMGFLLGLRTRPQARSVLAELRGRGILAGAARDPHVVRLLPPLILEDAHVDRLVEALDSMPMEPAGKEMS